MAIVREAVRESKSGTCDRNVTKAATDLGGETPRDHRQLSVQILEKLEESYGK